MDAKGAIRSSLKSSQKMMNMFLEDLSDQDLLVRPVQGANHIAWQLGHLINTECRFLTNHFKGVAPELPAGFAEQHSKENASVDPPKGFATKAVYLDLFNRARQATLDALERLPEADLDKPTEGPMASFFPTLGDLGLLVATHPVMHFGQFTVVRRKLGKPVLF